MEHEKYENFIKNKYYHWYDNIIKKAVSENRTYNSHIHEYHHALPDCLGGKELVILTFKEHYICHWLLTKFTTGMDNRKMIVAMSFFYYFKINTSAKRPMNAQKSVAYSNFKNQFIHSQKNYYATPENNPNYNPQKFIFRNIKTKKTYKYNRSEANSKIGLPHQEIYRLINRAFVNHKNTSSNGWDIYVEDLGVFSSDLKKEKNTTQHKKVICENCGKEINLGNYHRWHGKNCKTKK